MFAGGVVESGPVGRVFADPRHPYTRALIIATPERLQIARLQIPGARRAGAAPPDLYALPEGCHYRDRCPDATERCVTPPPWVALDDGHGARCHYAQRRAP